MRWKRAPSAARASYWLICRVEPGLELVRTRLFRSTSVLMRLDLPTLERPPNAISTQMGAGRDEPGAAPARNSAEMMRCGSRGALSFALAAGALFAATFGLFFGALMVHASGR